MKVHVLVGVDVVEREAGGAKRFELGADFPRQLLPHLWQKKEPDTGASQIPLEFAISANQRWDFGGGRYRASVDQHEVQSNSQPGHKPGPRHRVRRRWRADH